MVLVFGPLRSRASRSSSSVSMVRWVAHGSDPLGAADSAGDRKMPGHCQGDCKVGLV